MVTQEQHEQRAQYWRAVFDTVPIPAFVMDEDVRIEDFNTAAGLFLGTEPAMAMHRRGGEAFHCIHAEANGCGRSELCQDCVIRSSIAKAISGQATCRELHQVELRSESGTVPTELLVTASLLPYTKTPRVLLILENVTEIMGGHRPKRARRRRTDGMK